MKAYLKVKIKSLAVESTIIRHEERRYNVGSRGRKRARRALAKTNDLSKTQIKNLQKALQQPTEQDLQTFWGLRSHRIYDVRSEARSAQLAYAFINGTPYEKVEPTVCKDNKPDIDRIKRLVKKYAPPTTTGYDSALENWIAASGKFLS